MAEFGDNVEQVVVAAMFRIEGPADDELFEAVRMALAAIGASEIEAWQQPRVADV